MIPQRIELRTYPYQKHALPIKLRNLNIHNLPILKTRALRLELRI